jgi:hypothetical protein
MTLAVLRMRERREYQARHALDAGARLATAADAWTPPPPLAELTFPGRARHSVPQSSLPAPARRPRTAPAPHPRRANEAAILLRECSLFRVGARRGLHRHGGVAKRWCRDTAAAGFPRGWKHASPARA